MNPTRLLLGVIVLNAVIQASLLELPWWWVSVGLSAAVLLVSFAVAAHLAVHSLADVDVLRFGVWITGWTLAVSLGLMFYFWPGIVLLAVTPMVPVAVAAGAHSPLAANFAAIRDRPGKWLLTLVVTLVVIAVVWLASALIAFFVQGWIAAFASWLLVGAVAAWLLRAWAGCFRITPSISG